jgi:hypothetical protein
MVGRMIGRLIRPSDDRLHPGPLPLRQVVEDVPQFVDLTALDERGLAEDRAGDRTKRRCHKSTVIGRLFGAELGATIVRNLSFAWPTSTNGYIPSAWPPQIL